MEVELEVESDGISNETGNTTTEMRNAIEAANNSNVFDVTGDTTRSIQRHLTNTLENFEDTANDSVERNVREISDDVNYENVNNVATNYAENIENSIVAETESNICEEQVFSNNFDDVIYQVTLEENDSSRFNNNNEYSYNQSVDDMLYDSTDEESLNDDASDNDYSIDNDEIQGSRFTKLISLLQNNEYNEKIDATLSVNKAEIMLSVLQFSVVYNLPNIAVTDLCKMINSFFDKKIVPDTRYKIDNIFYPKDGIYYHAVCSNCGNYIKEYNNKDRYVTCSICEEREFLKASNYNNFFVVLDVDDELKNVIEINADYYLNVMREKDRTTEYLTDFHCGRKYKEFITNLPNEYRNSYATVIFNSDGSPIFKSSKFSVWPIQININEIPFSERYKNPITFALWFGNDKPKMSIFLKPFVEKMNQVSDNGITCKLNNRDVSIKIFALCCCVDTVARPQMQGFTQFNGYYGCSWCLHPGELVFHNKRSVVKYTISDNLPTKRTEENTLQYLEQVIESNTVVFGVRMPTPLLNINKFNIIDGFVPDAMHCIALGVVKQFTTMWLDVKNEPFSVSNDNVKLMNTFMKNFKVPTHIARLSRLLTERHYWKAREWENWVLYYSLPLLQEIRDFEVYSKHWSLLVQAFYILMQDSIKLEQLIEADNMLKKFVKETQDLYSKKAMTYNVHQLAHISQSVADWGPLWSHSGYSFESGNGKIVRTVHAAKGVLNQMCRNLSIKGSVNILKQYVSEESSAIDYCKYLNNRLTHKTERVQDNQYFTRKPLINDVVVRQHNLLPETIISYNKLVNKQNVFKSCQKVLLRSDNSFALTFNNEYIKIVQFLIDTRNDAEYTLCHKVVIDNNINNTCLCIKKVLEVEDEIILIRTSQIHKLCVLMTLKNKTYISAVPTVNLYS